MARSASKMAALLCAAVLCIWATSAVAAKPGHSGKSYFLLKSPGLVVELAVSHGHIVRADVAAPAFCPDGPAAQDVGFGISGGTGLPLRGPQHRFRKETQGSTRKQIFRGRVAADKAFGVFFENYREEPTGESGLAEEPLGPRCGNGNPHGEVVHFVARRVSAAKVQPSIR